MWTGRKEPFGHTRRLEPQPRGAVTRRAVAQRRSRASGLTRPLAEAIRGLILVLGWVLLSVRLPCSAAVWRKSFVLSLLPIRKVLVLSFLRARQRPSSCGLLLFSVSYPQDRRSYYLFFNYLFFNYLSVCSVWYKNLGGVCSVWYKSTH